MCQLINEQRTEFFARYSDTTAAAMLILPKVFEVTGYPKSIVDLGGGIGTWASSAKRLGVGKIVCVDAPDTRQQGLLIEDDEFYPFDLSKGMPPPILSDLAMSLEVAEHLPLCQSEAVVRFLVDSAPVVLFSASVPGQPGWGHVNEQPPKFWIDLFRVHGYQCVDAIRPRILGDSQIPYWYRQNIRIFVARSVAENLCGTPVGFDAITDDFELVHESVLRYYRNAMVLPGLRRWLRLFPKVLKMSVLRRFRA